MSQDKYAQDGVDVVQGDDFSTMAGAVCRASFDNSSYVEVKDFSVGHFRGPRGVRLRSLPEGVWMDTAPDGIGTKVVVIDAAMAHRFACNDLIAMTASDITRWGGVPLIFTNVLDVRTLGKPDDPTNLAFQIMIEGLGETAHRQGIVCFRGETAELGHCVGSENHNATTHFNWAGFMLGAYLEDRIVTGSNLKEGQVVVALREKSFRSNGLSSVRVALRIKFGEEWWENPNAETAIKAIAHPSTLYDQFLATVNGWYPSLRDPLVNMVLVTHVSGGGIVSKLADDMLFPRDLSAELYNLFDPPDIMKQVAEWREMSAEECYRTFNCGNGMLVVLNETDVSTFMDEAVKHDGIQTQVAGRITKPKGTTPTLIINSGFDDSRLEYVHHKT